MQTQPLILVVDDGPAIREFLSYTLAGEGFRVAVACDGREAMAAVQRERPDIVLTDLMMPEMSGWELCSRLRADRATAGLPIVAMSAISPQGVDADAFLPKPFELDDLLALLRVARARAAVKLSGAAAGR
jgi:two-component system response regulator MprA